MKYLYPDLQVYKWLNPPPEKPKEKKIPVDKTYKIKYINNIILKNTHNMSALRLLSGECNNEYLQCKITFQDTNLFLAYQREKIDKPLVWHVFSKELFSLNNCLKASIKKRCNKCKIIRRRGSLLVICINPRCKQKQG